MADIKPVDPFTGSQQLPTPPNIEDNEAAIYNMDRTLPRQVSTGTMRGTQTITGEMRIAQPETGAGIISASGITQNITVSEPLTGLKRILIGKLPDGTWGEWVSKPTFDVSKVTSSTLGNLIFNSNQNVFKIVSSGTATIPGGSTSAINDFQYYDLQHNLGFAPMVFAFIVNGTFSGDISYQPLPYSNFNAQNVKNGGTGYALVASDYVDIGAITSTYVRFKLSVANDSYPLTRTYIGYTIKYYLLQETAN